MTMINPLCLVVGERDLVVLDSQDNDPTHLRFSHCVTRGRFLR